MNKYLIALPIFPGSKGFCHRTILLRADYEMLKDLNTAADKANKFIGDDGYQKKVFRESLKQLENSVSSYMSNIETVNNRMLPKLHGFNANMAYNEENGRSIIEEYQKSRLQIEVKQ